METNWTKTIEQYLTGELDATQRAAFEQELAKSAALREELELHQLTHQIIERATLRDMVKQGGKTYVRLRQLKISALVLAVLLVVGAGVFYAIKSKSKNESAPIEQLDDAVLKRMQSFLEFENIDPEYFGFTGESDVFLSESGVLLSVTDNSFLQNGKPYSGPAVIQWQEAQEAADIVKAGLSTTSGDKLLETQGMFSLKAFTPEGKPLDLSNSGVYVQVPVNENKEGMQLFQGVKGKDGQIDWQNPKPLERIPQAKSMNKMDLFPPDYEPKLNELKWFKEKEKRDSLYLSFDEEFTKVESDTIGVVEEIAMLGNNVKKWSQVLTQSVGRALQLEYSEDKAKWNFAVEHAKGKTYVVARVHIDKNWHINSLYLPKGSFGYPTSFRVMPNKAYQLIGKPIEPQPIEMHDELANEDLRYHEGFIVLRQEIKPLTTGKIPIQVKYAFQPCDATHCLPPYEGSYGIEIPGKKVVSNHIPPSKVLAIWRPKFDGTILATRDFEKRMQAIHRTCNKKVLEVYTNNLSEPLWQKDERVAKMGYSEFKAFAAERVGAMNINDEHARNLAAFYATVTDILRNKGKREAEETLALERKWDDQVNRARNKQFVQPGLRGSANQNERENFNLQNLSRQIGNTVGFQLNSSYNLREIERRRRPITVNLDKYVRSFIANPIPVESIKVNIVQKKIPEFKNFSLKLQQIGLYDKAYMYVISNQQYSFRRLDFNNGAVINSLNQAMNYKAVVFAMNKEGFHIYEIQNLQAKDYNDIQLESVDDAEFNQRMQAYSEDKLSQKQAIKNELSWLFKEKQNYKVLAQRKKNEQFRNMIRPTIYPCLQLASGRLASGNDTINSEPRSIENESEQDKVYTITDTPPEFSSGVIALRKFIADNFNVPETCESIETAGKVIVKFVVNERGEISDCIIRKNSFGCKSVEEEVKRVVKLMSGKFNPGLVNGKSVKSYFSLPITIHLK